MQQQESPESDRQRQLKTADKVRSDRAMDAMKHNKYDVARLSLQP